MCLVSNVGDDWSRRFRREWPEPLPDKFFPDGVDWQPKPPTVSRQEFDRLVKMVEEMRKELEAAKKQDIADGNPDCEMEEKIFLLKGIAKALGLDLGDVFNVG